MSRPTSAASLSTVHSRRSGRHRLDLPTGVRATDIHGVRERLVVDRTPDRLRSSFLRWLFSTAPTGRHTWSFLAHSGGRPRTAFAIILSL